MEIKRKRVFLIVFNGESPASLFGYLDNFFFPAIAMNQIMSTNRHRSDFGINDNPGQTAGKRLFIDMGVIKDPGRNNLSIRSDNIPAICVMLPPLIIMGNGHSKTIALSLPFYCNFYDICFPGKPTIGENSSPIKIKTDNLIVPPLSLLIVTLIQGKIIRSEQRHLNLQGPFVILLQRDSFQRHGAWPDRLDHCSQAKPDHWHPAIPEP